MQTLDYVVLFGYFALMVLIGVICSWRIKGQEDFFMGGRSFGKFFQTFAAFGAGTGSQDPIQVSRTTWTSGLSGIWSVLMWLFVTPFYWIFGVWYRRMRHLTLGDWFVERYESRAMGAVYAIMAFMFQTAYLSTMFSAISKVAVSLVGFDTIVLPGIADPIAIQFLLVPLIALVVIAYGVGGGLSAAYWTDVIQGMCIILLSVILIPRGLSELVAKYGAQYGDVTQMTAMDGFRIMHERVPDAYFQLFSGPRSGEFPIHYIFSLTLLGLIGIVVQPHFITTGGGSAKSENAARIGLVTGNFLKRFCTIGWALTALILLALMADSPEAAQDPDQVWGIATRELLGPLNMGLVGLMLACLLAALMSSADCYMVVFSSLAVRNIYAAYFNANASEKAYVTAGRIVGPLVIVGAVVIALGFYDVFGQYKMSLEMIVVCAAPFWVGMFWRRATRWAAWTTMAFSVLAFFVIPAVAPRLVSTLRTNPSFTVTTDIVETTFTREAGPTDFAARQSWETAYATALEMDDTDRMKAVLKKLGPPSTVSADATEGHAVWETAFQAAMAEKEGARTRSLLKELGTPPPLVAKGRPKDNVLIKETFVTGGQAIFWTSGLRPVGEVHVEEVGRDESEGMTVVTRRREGEFEGEGMFRIDFLAYEAMHVDLRSISSATLETLRLPPRLFAPFLVMILVSLITPRGSREALDRFYVKMKTPVIPDHDQDGEELERSYQDPSRFDHKKLFPGSSLEFQKPTMFDVVGFLVSVAICFLFLGIAVWLAGIGRT
ncbi:MAG: sodium:solute symporter [Pirellulales bacterium]